MTNDKGRESVADSSMDTPKRSRRRSFGRAGAIVLLLGLMGTIYAALTPGTNVGSSSTSAAVSAGRQLYIQGCASCHGLTGQGSDTGTNGENQGPSIIGAGPAAVDFQVGTGRMPLKNHSIEATEHRQEYTSTQILDMAEYVGTFGVGPAIPTDVDYADSNIAVGGALFRTNCAQCHNFDGSGGALTGGKSAPSLSPASPKEIYEAMLTGPENMPVFGNQQITPAQKLAIIKYVKDVQYEADPGGLNLGRVGPVPEGLIAWVGGIGILVLSVIWIGSKS